MSVTDPIDLNKITIKLERGKTGLGFNIKGGKDMQVMQGDDSIYVAKLKADGAAAVDGRLKVGDKIVEVNGVNLESVKHEVAVETFVKAGATVTVVAIQGAEHVTRRKLMRKVMEQDSNSSTKTTIYIVVGVAATFALGALWVYRLRQGRAGLFRSGGSSR